MSALTELSERGRRKDEQQERQCERENDEEGNESAGFSKFDQKFNVDNKDIEAYLKRYPIEKFPNWSLTSDAYYVQAPIDRMGEFAFHLRSHLTSLILAGNPAIVYLQRHQSSSLTLLALIFSRLGLEEFFFALVTTFLWLFDARLGRILSALLALGFTVSGSIKSLLCLPRPPVPPAIRLSEEDKDWAWPSNHALTGTMFPWFIWIYASSNYQLSFTGSLLLLFCVLTWNGGVIWSRAYLGVHSPCDIAAGWVMGVILLFISIGFCTHMDEFYLRASVEAPWKLLYFASAALLAIYLQPRTWPETQSIGEVMCVVPGALIGIFTSRIFGIGGSSPALSLHETSPNAPTSQYVIRFFVGCIVAAVVRLISKRVFRRSFVIIYNFLGIRYYSFSSLCSLCPIQPDKRFSSRLRFKPTSNKFFPQSDIPYDIDLPVKFIVYSLLGFTVSELCPVIFKKLGV